ncbi:uncharacterized protein LOC142325224 [Lycorma delicatula]|uniref:uncharacterized protein LOC142325224 n=1 Tax=Lycorma delicatula TaxID=130591 RepID=UPI003F50FC29
MRNEKVKTVETVLVILLLFANQGMSLSISSNEMPTAPLEHRLTIEEIKPAAVNLLPHLKVFPYVEHACYKTNNSCETIAKDCGDYYRLLVCCCHRMLGSKWKEVALGKSDLIQAPSALSFFIILLLELI